MSETYTSKTEFLSSNAQDFIEDNYYGLGLMQALNS